MLGLVVLALLLASPSLSGPLSRSEIAKPRADDVNYRLPGEVIPSAYTIKLTPNFEEDNFVGTVKIEIQATKATKTITLHIRELELPPIDKIKVTEVEQQKSIQVTSAAKDGTKEQEFFKITLAEDLEKDKRYTLEISDFKGVLNSQYQGFYLATFEDEQGTKRKFATTQFEPTAARRAFPCFDEPALKATFKITLVRPNEKYISISNTPIEKSSPVTGTTQIEDTFAETVKMSTYLVAFIVTEMELSKNQGIHRVLAKAQDLKAGKQKFALDTGEAVLNRIETFVNVPYTLAKMDQAAIPDKDFSAGAMENWGLVTYRETYLLYSQATTLLSRQQSIATIISHEFGHQWFGNLVSPAWWEYLWLNEGFATYFEHRAADLVQPTWEIMKQFVVKNTQFAFGPDSLESTRPMNQDAGTPTEISNLFDRVAYEKSGSVIRMMEAFLSTPVFSKGLEYYLKAKRYSAATPTDLYENIQKAVDEATPAVLPTGLSVKEIMTSWDSEKGFPVVTVTRNYGVTEKNVKLGQSRFLLNNPTSTNTNKWIIPINYATQSSSNFDVTTPDVWLKEKEETVTVPNLPDEEWLILNKQETGYYRVNYDATNWNLLISALIADYTKIDALNRAQLIDDAFNLARSQRLSYTVPLQLSLYLAKETEYFPFYSFFTAATFVNNMVAGTAAQSQFQLHVTSVLSGINEFLGFDEKTSDSHVDKLNRVNVLTWLCNLGDSDCRTKSLEKFRAWKDSNSPIALNLEAPIFCGAMRLGTQEDWDFLYNQYATADDVRRVRIINGLGCSESVEILQKFLEKATANDNELQPQAVFAAVYNAGPTGVNTALDYLKEHFAHLNAEFASSVRPIINGLAGKLTTTEQVDQLKAIAEENNQQTLFEAAVAAAETNVNWNEKNLAGITSWLTRDPSGSRSYMYPSFLVIAVTYVLRLTISS